MSNSQTIVPTTTHPGDSTTITLRGDKYKGDGYYSRADGLHTVQIKLTGFIGTIEIEATLGVDPQDPFYTNCNDGTDWSPVVIEESTCVLTTGLYASQKVPFKLEYTEPETSVGVYHFTGNFTWIRAYITNWTDGTINSIKMNH